MKVISRISAVIVLGCCLLVTACGNQKTVEDYYSKPEIREQLDAMLEQERLQYADSFF